MDESPAGLPSASRVTSRPPPRLHPRDQETAPALPLGARNPRPGPGWVTSGSRVSPRGDAAEHRAHAVGDRPCGRTGAGRRAASSADAPPDRRPRPLLNPPTGTSSRADRGSPNRVACSVACTGCSPQKRTALRTTPLTALPDRRRVPGTVNCPRRHGRRGNADESTVRGLEPGSMPRLLEPPRLLEHPVWSGRRRRCVGRT